ncbi:23S rRNA (guanosine(2251)-2'-O)-methyltransferase RlmB [Clostridiaceae bacterium M8S5]|nr:23S rRNA (guanosine(2251)-2'-O)-methyltransferase RlmB [Clostridiaceae bacterium M8S5]
MDNIISSPNNKLIKQVRALSKRKDRWKEQKFVVDGIRSVREAIMNSAEIDFLLYTKDIKDKQDGIKLLELCIDKQYRAYMVDDKLMNNITETENPQGIIAVVNFDIKQNEIELKQDNNFIVILDRLQDPGNMGSIIRTADALGVNAIILTKGCVDLYNPKTVRSTMGSIFHINISYYEDNNKLIEKLKQKNISIMSTALDADYSCYDVNLKKNIALIIGNEAQGVSDYFLNSSDITVNIPMKGKAESLNAAIASGILMYEVSRQRN